MVNKRSPKQKPPVGSVPNFSHSLSQGLVGWWLFNEQGGTKANDISGRYNNGTLTGGPTWNNQSLSFNGVNDSIVVPDSTSWAFGTSDFSLSMWIKPTTVAQYVFVSQYQDTNNRWIWFMEDATAMYFQNRTAGVLSPNESWTPNLTIGMWQHLVLTRSGNTWTVYKNASAVTGGSTDTGSVGNHSGSLEIGSQNAASSFNGSIDDVRVYNRALSAQEVRTLYETPYINIANVKRRKVTYIVPSHLIIVDNY